MRRKNNHCSHQPFPDHCELAETMASSKSSSHNQVHTKALQFKLSVTPCRNFSNFFLKTTRSIISVQILVLVSMRKYILSHK